MSKKKPAVPQGAPVSPALEDETSTRVKDTAADAETNPGVNGVIPEPEPVGSGLPGPGLPESEQIEGTRALNIRPADLKVATEGQPKKEPSSEENTRPISIEHLHLAEKLEVPPTEPVPTDKQIPEDGTQMIPTKRSPNADTGPLPPEPEPPPPSRYNTVPQEIQKRPSTSSGMPSWAWALAGGVGALALAGASITLYQRFATHTGSARIQETAPETSAAPETTPTEAEVPIALRSYIEKSQTGSDQDRGVAMATLGTMYTQGLNVERNEKKGREWYEKAAALGNKYAVKRLAENPTLGK